MAVLEAGLGSDLLFSLASSFLVRCLSDVLLLVYWVLLLPPTSDFAFQIFSYLVQQDSSFLADP